MLLLIYLICPIICAIVAGSKHRSVVGWFVLGLILPVISLIIILAVGDARPQTIIINNHLPPAPPPELPKGVDTSRWSKRDRDAYERQRRGYSEPRLIEARPNVTAAAAAQHQPAVVCLKILAEAGRGFDAAAVEAVTTYLEAEAGAEYSRREAAKLAAWMQALPADETTVHASVKGLASSVGRLDAFRAAGATIIGPTATERQEKLAAYFQRVFSGASA